jgi:hypothetical protein
MGKVTLNPLVSSDSSIYNQPISIGARFTKPPPKHPLEGIDLQNLPFDPAVEAGKVCESLDIKAPKEKP